MSSVNPFNVFGNPYFIQAVIEALGENTIFIGNLITPAITEYIALQLEDPMSVAVQIYDPLVEQIVADSTVDGVVLPATESIMNYFLPSVLSLLGTDAELVQVLLSEMQQYIESFEKSVTSADVLNAAISFISLVKTSGYDITWFAQLLNSTTMLQSELFKKNIQLELDPQTSVYVIPPFVLYNRVSLSCFDFKLPFSTLTSLRFANFTLQTSVANSLKRVVVKTINLFDMQVFSVLFDETYPSAVTTKTITFSSQLMNDAGNINSIYVNNSDTLQLEVCIYCELLNNAFVTSSLTIVLNKSNVSGDIIYTKILNFPLFLSTDTSFTGTLNRNEIQIYDKNNVLARSVTFQDDPDLVGDNIQNGFVQIIDNKVDPFTTYFVMKGSICTSLDNGNNTYYTFSAQNTTVPTVPNDTTYKIVVIKYSPTNVLLYAVRLSKNSSFLNATSILVNDSSTLVYMNCNSTQSETDTITAYSSDGTFSVIDTDVTTANQNSFIVVYTSLGMYQYDLKIKGLDSNFIHSSQLNYRNTLIYIACNSNGTTDTKTVTTFKSNSLAVNFLTFFLVVSTVTSTPEAYKTYGIVSPYESLIQGVTTYTTFLDAENPDVSFVYTMFCCKDLTEFYKNDSDVSNLLLSFGDDNPNDYVFYILKQKADDDLLSSLLLTIKSDGFTETNIFDERVLSPITQQSTLSIDRLFEPMYAWFQSPTDLIVKYTGSINSITVSALPDCTLTTYVLRLSGDEKTVLGCLIKNCTNILSMSLVTETDLFASYYVIRCNVVDQADFYYINTFIGNRLRFSVGSVGYNGTVTFKVDQYTLDPIIVAFTQQAY